MNWKVLALVEAVGRVRRRLARSLEEISRLKSEVARLERERDDARRALAAKENPIPWALRPQVPAAAAQERAT